MTCSACIGAVGSIIFDYETLGLSGEALANILTPLCNIALDKDVHDVARNIDDDDNDKHDYDDEPRCDDDNDDADKDNYDEGPV